CLIIGAGMAGLLAAHTLTTAGWQVTVLDKGRGVGGRMANRRLNEAGTARADHGAQFFTVRSDRFRHWVDDWLAAGVAAEWTRGFGTHDGHPRYRGVPGMTAIAKQLAQALAELGASVQTGVRVTAVQMSQTPRPHWQAITADQQTIIADALLLTPPVEQTLALLTAGQVPLPPDAQQALAQVQYDPCFAVLAELDSPSQIPAPGGVQVQGELISWIADNQQKGVSAVPTVTIHASPAFTRAHYEDDFTAVADQLLRAAEEAGWLRVAQVKTVQVQRWRYAQPRDLYPERCLVLGAEQGLPLVAFAGDAFAEARVEGAALSGLAAAAALLKAQKGA
ncbi:MAG: FAD-dependent oxidoreductase, partial [Anaerolineales bacterium]|nr:FAD-dependent oxidoreductase [Anaerolineales bacterium]